jgi:heme A synthase
MKFSKVVLSCALAAAICTAPLAARAHHPGPSDASALSMLPLAVSTAHATLAQLFFCTTVSLAVFTSRRWTEARVLPEEKGMPPLRWLCTTALVTIFLQLILGATLRHSATWDHHLPVQLVLAHIGGAFAVTLTLGGAALSVLRRHKGETFLTRPAAIALALLVVQLFLGVAAYVARLGSPLL